MPLFGATIHGAAWATTGGLHCANVRGEEIVGARRLPMESAVAQILGTGLCSRTVLGSVMVGPEGGHHLKCLPGATGPRLRAERSILWMGVGYPVP
jgi:hypothetical protein